MDLLLAQRGGSIGCSGQNAPGDQARWEHLTTQPPEKPKGPEFRQQEVFPQRTDETILAMPNPVTPEFVVSIQEALSGLEKILVTGDDVKKALLTGGSPATSGACANASNPS